MTQTIIVDISTRGANPVAYTHQGDTDRTFFVEALKQVAESYGVSVIDGYHNLGMNAANFATMEILEIVNSIF